MCRGDDAALQLSPGDLAQVLLCSALARGGFFRHDAMMKRHTGQTAHVHSQNRKEFRLLASDVAERCG
jgi:hypothetical protein